MKKLLIVILASCLSTNFLHASDLPKEFNKFLLEKGLTKKINICKEEKQYSKKWFDAGCENRPGGVFKEVNDLDIKRYKDRANIPWDGKPNRDTLFFYAWKYLDDDAGFEKIGSKASNNPYKFEFNLRENKDVNKEILNSGLLSYLLYEDGKIVVDKKTPKDRFGALFDDTTRWTSASVGKSMVSYVVGHAICDGYIESLDTKINDWPLIENSLYHDQKLIDLLNMAAGDQKYSKTDLTKGKKWHKNPNRNTVKFHMKEGIFKNTKGKKSKSKYNYSNVVSNIVINYVWFKSQGNFEKLLEKIFKDKAKVANSVHFLMHDKDSVQGNYNVTENDGPIRYSFNASRYDYLRIAKAMLDDWQNDTCAGKFLKTLYQNKIPRNEKWKDNNSPALNPKSYSGFFYFDYSGLKNKPVMGMDGYGGQSILIDFEKSRIIVINSIHIDYNWKKIAHSVIKKGK
jgi:hypothetical protein